MEYFVSDKFVNMKRIGNPYEKNGKLYTAVQDICDRCQNGVYVCRVENNQPIPHPAYGGVCLKNPRQLLPAAAGARSGVTSTVAALPPNHISTTQYGQGAIPLYPPWPEITRRKYVYYYSFSREGKAGLC